MMFFRLLAVAAVVSAVGCAHSGTAQNPAPSRDALLSVDRINAVASNESAWLAYLRRSQDQRAQDSMVMAKELTLLARTEMTQAPYARTFEITDKMTAAWLASDSARLLASNLLSFQTPNGGWSKHVDYTKGPRDKGQSWFSESNKWQWIATIDNSSTTEQMSFLLMIDSVRSSEEYRTAWQRGFEYLLAAQFPNGCWPQVWPLDGGYHDAATFNDDATTNVLTTLQAAADGKPSFLSTADRERAKNAVTQGIECVLNAQYVENGVLTVWGQQHDPLTLKPTNARSYELTSLTAQESANLMRFLIKQKNPTIRTMQAIIGAAKWLESHKLFGYTYDFATGRHDSPGAGPIWGRMYEIGTDKPIFSNRDGMKLYDWNQLTDRRLGYAWYTYAPVLALRQYEAWAKKRVVQ